MVLICANYQRYGDVRSNHEDMGKIMGIQWGHIDIYIYTIDNSVADWVCLYNGNSSINHRSL